jgi:hypothetical protein
VLRAADGELSRRHHRAGQDRRVGEDVVVGRDEMIRLDDREAVSSDVIAGCQPAVIRA